ncbi:MAG: ATP-binding protein [Bryobacterales bacterium]|nr:ATP-binding protein [Bryobacterales bacterium]
MTAPTMALGGFLPRHVDTQVRTSLSDTRIVAVLGPRQSGKTTLVQRIARDANLPYVTLDHALSRRFALDDPIGFVRAFPAAAIDELQRAPELVLALKHAVDEDPRPGRYIVTGSVDLLASAVSPDSLAGRVESVELLPFSQAEIAGLRIPRFLGRAFRADFPRVLTLDRTENLIERILTGGYPEAVARTTARRRTAWLRAYARLLVRRDVSQTFRVSKLGEMARLVDHAGALAGGLLNLSRLGSELGIDAKTIDRWLELIEHLFLVRRVPAWHRNDVKRLVKAPKLHFLDSGLLAAVRRVGAPAIARNRGKVGQLLECLVFSEIVKTPDLADRGIVVSHYRDKDKVEVDLVLEHPDGRVVGIEVKASATVGPRDFRGLARLKAACGDSFSCGILLHDGDRVQEVAPRQFLMPVSMLWES